MALALSSQCRHEHATRGVRADRVGAKLPARAIAPGRRRTKRLRCLGRPLARDSRLAAHRKVRRHPRSFRQPMRKLGQTGCSSGRPEGRSRGVRADRGRARGSHWLQKSTGGVWPVSPSSEELVDNDVGSSQFARELEVANERRKPDRRRQSREIGGGSPNRRNTRKRSCRRHSVDGRRSGPGKPWSLTRRRWQRSWLLAKLGFPSGAGRDRERQRSIVSSACGRKHRGGEAPPSGGRPVLPPNGEGGAVPIGPKLESRAVKRGPSRGWVVERRSGAALVRSISTASAVMKSHEAVGAAQAARPEVERFASARAVSRLQRSVRSIFPARARRAARQTESGCG